MTEIITTREPTGLEIAVIGMAGRFPGAGSVEEFWDNLKNEVESINFFSRKELEEAGVSDENIDRPNFIPARGVLEDVEYFDASFFGYPPLEAELMDPQTRILYECAWWALENTGYSPDMYEGNIGFFAGATNNRNWEGRALVSGKAAAMGGGAFTSDILMDRDFLSTRIAYRLNLTGPAITLKTACSTSLVAIDLACRMLLTGQCTIALAGGVSMPASTPGYYYEDGLIYSPDGHCRAFDAKAKGVVFSDGVGIVVLKGLEEAVTDGDNIFAVILGSAVNNDGTRKGAYSAPSAEGQAESIRAAHLIAGVDPESITYIEAHGTGTTLGDPLELEGLKMAFNTDKKGYCAIGSVKSNIGHLDTTAGVASFIKAVLAVKHNYIPASLHFKEPNPKIDFENSPFYVNTKLREWTKGDHPRRAGVSSFGVGGTNAHVVLEEAPDREPSSESRKNQLILLSAKNDKALDQMTENFAAYLKENPGLSLADAAYTLKVGRSPFKLKQMLVVSSTEEAVNALTPVDDTSLFDTDKVFRSTAREETRPIFMFSGQGSQYIDMGLDLYHEEPGFAEEMDRCFEIFQSIMNYDIKEILYPADSPQRTQSSQRINQTEIAQPVIFMIEYALAGLLMKWGVIPYAMIGHSIGEYVAACLSGVFSLEDAIKLVAIRGKLMQQMSPGSMLSVPLPEEELTVMLDDQLELAAVNGPEQCVVSGSEQSVHRFAEKLKEKSLQTRVLHTSHAFHSRFMDSMLKEFEMEVGKITLNKPEIPYISNLTGTWITVEEAADPGYWSRHLRHTVRFAAGLTELLKEEHALLIEVGPGRALSTFARQNTDRKPGQKIVNLLRHPKEDISDTRYLLDKIGRLWMDGQTIDWQAFYCREKRYRVPLPLYPFQRQSYWIPREVLDNLGSNALGGSRSMNKKKNPADWFYIPSWKRTSVSGPGFEEPLNWIVFTDECGIGVQLVEWLRKAGHSVDTVVAGSTFTHNGKSEFVINPHQPEDYVTLLKKLEEEKKSTQRILHLWNITQTNNNPGWGADWNRDYLDTGFYSLLYLAQAIGRQNIKEKLRMTVFTNQVQEALGSEELCPEKAVVLGPVNVIPQEFPNIFCNTIDLEIPAPGSPGEKTLAHQLIEEISSDTLDTVIAYRSNYRLVQTYEPAPLNGAKEVKGLQEILPRLKEKGVYLVTGGLGGIGLVLAKYLAQHVNARLILTGRSQFLPRQEWEQWLSSHPVTDPLSRKIRQVKELELLGAEVLVLSVDVTDFQGMQKALAGAQEQFGPVNGVVHAAGLPGDGMIQLKTREMADSVLLPKVRGTLALDTLLKDAPVDFIILCSSISSVVPQLGQVDYFSANAFMDAYAFYKNRVDGVFTVSINWDAWQEVGMAVEAAKDTVGPPPEKAPQPLEIPHPLFEHYIPLGENRRKYISYLSLEKNWTLSEHMTSERKGLLPGTTYLEMARAALESYIGSGPMEIIEANFMIPMIVNKGEVREVHLILEKQTDGDYFQFQVESTLPTEVDFLQRHVFGKIRPLPPGTTAPPAFNIEELKAQCTQRQFVFDETEAAKPMGKREKEYLPEGLLIFGSHWKVTRWAMYSNTAGLRMFQLPPDYSHEVGQYKLHPSLMDVAAGFIFGLLAEGSAYIPFAYRGLRMFRPMPAKIVSYSRYTADNEARKDFLKFNVTVMDEEGRVCVDVGEFTMLEVSENVKNRIQAKEKASSPLPLSSDQVSSREELNEKQKQLLRIGIHPAEGVDVFRRILATPVVQPQLVVSTFDLPMRLQAQKQSALEQFKDKDSQEGTLPGAARHARPELSNPYVPPQTEPEKVIAHIFQEQLGIEVVGIDDDFFELGGDSLKAVTVSGKIQKVSEVEVPMAEFFNRPTVKRLAQYISSQDVAEVQDTLEPTEKKDHYALSSAQERLFVLHRLAPQDTSYNLSRGIEFIGDMDKEVVEAAIRKLIKRHECLRTSFDILDNKSIQKVHGHVDFKLQYYDLTTDGCFKEEIISRFVQPFNLGKPPLMRAALIKVKEKRYILMTDFHHIITDAHSILFIFVRDFTALSMEEALPPLEYQYKDFSRWQNRQKYLPAMKRQEEFWLEEFKKGVPVLNLPLDYKRPVTHSFEGDWVIFPLDASVTEGFRKLLLEEEATLFMGLLAVYNLLLFKLSGQEDIVVGTPAAGRSHPDLQPVMGMFVNMMVLRNFPAGEKTFTRLLKELKARTIKAFENQNYQFEDLVEKLALERIPGRNPLFDVNISLQSVAEKSAQMTGKEGEYLDIETRASKFDLSLEFIEIGDSLHCKFEYKTKLFKRETIERFVTYFKEIVSAVIKNKNIRLKDIIISHDLLEPTTTTPQMEFEF